MAGPDVPLSKAEVLWGEMIETIGRVSNLLQSASELETRIDSSTQTLESMLHDLDGKLEEIGAHAGQVATKRSEELRKEIDAAKERLMITLQERDAKVQSRIVEDVGEQLTGVADALKQTMTTLVAQEIRSVAAVAKTSWKDTGRAKWLAMAVTAVIAYGLLAATGGWWLSKRYTLDRHQEQVDTLIKGASGEAAVRLAELNNLRAMTECTGFQRVDSNEQVWCLPVGTDKKIYGWRIK